jgi:uncharacterized protein
MLFIQFCIATCCLMFVASCGQQEPATATHATYPYAVLKPVDLQDVQIHDNFWQPIIERSRDVGTLDYLEKFEAHGNIDNFRIVAQNLENEHVGFSNNNEFVYKLMEAAGYYAASSEPVRKAFGALNATVLAAQDEDGYLNTWYQNPVIVKQGKQTRFNVDGRFEFYNFGHLTQAAIVWYRTTGDDALLQGMIKFADLIVEKFGAPNKLPYKKWEGLAHKKYEHPNHEMAMVELYRVTGDRRYLEFAKQTLDQYGFWDFPEIYGHAVQETLLLTGGADVYLEYGSPAMLASLTRLWHDMRDRKMYISGGIGSAQTSEAYGTAYELPNDVAYAETCASIASVFFNYRMLLATGDSKYADCMERNLYNGMLVGIAHSGTEYFYRNVFEFDPEKPVGKMDGTRKPWFKTSCCPGNVHRLLASMQQYIYTTTENGMQVHLYAGSEITAKLSNGMQVKVKQETNYPWDGDVTLTVEPDDSEEFAMQLRLPGWAGKRNAPDDLYYFVNLQTARPDGISVQVNGQDVPVSVDKGYLSITRTWQRGDVITLHLPMPIRRALTNEIVEANRRRVVVQRGPLVYCAEGIDNGGKTLSLELPDKSTLKAQHHPKLLDGVTVITGQARRNAQDTNLMMIPYYAWANRGPGEMVVWLRRVAAK